MTSAIQATVPTLKINGTSLSDVWYDNLIEVQVDLEFRVPGRATLRFLDEGYALTSHQLTKLGAAVVVGARGPAAKSDDVLLDGQITGISVEQTAGNRPELVLVVHDKAHLLARGSAVTTHQSASYADVVRQTASAHGLSADVESTAEVLDYLLHADTPMGLLNAIADRVGCDWWVQGSTLHFRSATGSPRARDQLRLVLGQNLVSFDVRATGMHVDKVQVDGWDRKRQQAVTANAAASGASVKAESDMLDAFVTPHAKLGPSGGVTLRTAAIPVQSKAEAQHVANALRDQVVSSAVSASGTVVHGSTLVPGMKVVVADAGPTSGTYHVSRVQHVFREVFETRFFAGERRPQSLADTLGGGEPDSLQHGGLVVGEVTNVNDPEKSGRVRVRFSGVDATSESAWARTLQLGAGAARGLVVLPEVGDEVLVGFEGGDTRQPVVLGGLFGDRSTIPLWDVEGGKVNSRRLTSRLGHVVEVKDGTGPADQYVLMELAGKKHFVKLAKDKLDVAVPSGVPLSMKVGDTASLVFDNAGSLTIKAVNITLEAEGTLTMTSKAPAKLESQATMTVAGQMTTVKGSMVQVQSSGPATIKGTPVAIN